MRGGYALRNDRKMSDQQGDQNENGHAADRGSKINTALRAFVNAFDRAYQTASNAQNQTSPNKINWNAVTAVAAVIYTFFTAGLLAAGIWSAIQSTNAVNVAVDTEKRQLRAYAYPVPLAVEDLNEGAKPSAGIDVTSLGSTPAYDVRGVVVTGGFVHPLPAGQELKEDYDATRQNKTLVVPQ